MTKDPQASPYSQRVNNAQDSEKTQFRMGMVLKVECALEPPGQLATAPITAPHPQSFWLSESGETWELAFWKSSQVILVQLVQGLHFVNEYNSIACQNEKEERKERLGGQILNSKPTIVFKSCFKAISKSCFKICFLISQEYPLLPAFTPQSFSLGALFFSSYPPSFFFSDLGDYLHATPNI